MENIKALFELAYNIMSIKINLFSYSVSLWGVFIFTGLLSILMYFIFKMLD